MKLIGAGLPRTATTTQMIALEQLGLPCYHMRDMMADLEKGVDVWRRAYDGEAPWDEVFEGYQSTVDWPSALVYFGESLVHHLAQARYHVDEHFHDWIDLMIDMCWQGRGPFAGTDGESGPMMEAAERWNQSVIDGVPAERLLVWEAREGWEPLCEFLGVDVPDEPLPHVNDTEAFRAQLMIGPAIDSLSEWWEREQQTATPAGSTAPAA